MKLNTKDDIDALLGKNFSDRGMILKEEDLSPDFFNLSSGLAGDLFQKFTTYSQKLALVVADLSAYSDRIQELAFEHKTHPCIRFVSDLDQANAWVKRTEE